MVFSLAKIIELEDLNKPAYSYFKEQIDTFESQNEDVSIFLKERAVDYEKRNKSRTFLCFSDKGLLEGYFSLSVKNLMFSKTALVSGTTRNKISGTGKDADSALVYLIGQLGRDSNRSKNGFGETLLKTAFKFLYQAQSIVGIRYCLVETENVQENQKVIDFYKKNGFTFLQNDKSDHYQQLVIKMK